MMKLMDNYTETLEKLVSVTNVASEQQCALQGAGLKMLRQTMARMIRGKTGLCIYVWRQKAMEEASTGMRLKKHEQAILREIAKGQATTGAYLRSTVMRDLKRITWRLFKSEVKDKLQIWQTSKREASTEEALRQAQDSMCIMKREVIFTRQESAFRQLRFIFKQLVQGANAACIGTWLEKMAEETERKEILEAQPAATLARNENEEAVAMESAARVTEEDARLEAEAGDVGAERLAEEAEEARRIAMKEREEPEVAIEAARKESERAHSATEEARLQGNTDHVWEDDDDDRPEPSRKSNSAPPFGAFTTAAYRRMEQTGHKTAPGRSNFHMRYQPALMQRIEKSTSPTRWRPGVSVEAEAETDSESEDEEPSPCRPPRQRNASTDRGLSAKWYTDRHGIRY